MKGNSFKVTDKQLVQDLDLVNLASGRCLAEEYPDYYTERTRTALRYIGADPDDVLDAYITCPKCWKLTPMNGMYQLESATCGVLRSEGGTCNGILFTQKHCTRTPSKVVAYLPLSTFLSLILQDPDVIKHLQDWREKEEDDDIDNTSAGLTTNRGSPYKNQDFVMRGFWHGTEWRRQQANTQREVDTVTKEVQELPVSGPGGIRHSSLRYGLKIILNIDW